jgi:hypothetical protein
VYRVDPQLLLSELVNNSVQDSMAPVEVGDAELHAGLAEVRERLDDVPARAREFLRTLGRYFRKLANWARKPGHARVDVA